MRIVYFVDHLRPYGTQHALQQLVEGLAERGHEQAVVCLNDSWDDVLVTSLREAGAEVRIISKLALVTCAGLLTTWRWLKSKQFEVAVTLLFVSDVLGRYLACAAGVPRIISSIRARNAHYANWQRWIVRRTMPWADAVVLNSEHVRDFAIMEEGAQPDRVYVIPNGVEIEEYDEPMNHTELGTEFGIAEEQLLVGSVGRLVHQKGIDVLLQALTLIPRQDISLLLVGTGKEEQSLQTQASTLGLEQRVHFVGYRRDVPRLLRVLDLYVHPARFEGMPNALLEAMGAGCPIIASAVDGNRELIEDGVNGWLVPAGDAKTLSEAIQAALSDPEQARRRGAASKQRAVEYYSTDRMVDAWEGLMKGRLNATESAERMRRTYSQDDSST